MRNIGGKGSPEHFGVEAVDYTLRQIAKLPPPPGLEDRVKARVHRALAVVHDGAPRAARILAWRGNEPGIERGSGLDPLSQPGAWMRKAAAAAIVCVVAGGSWSVYSRVQPSSSAWRAVTAPHGTMSAAGEFSNSKAMRTPQTLSGPLPRTTSAVPKGAAAPGASNATPPSFAKKKHNHATAPASAPPAAAQTPAR